MGDVLEEGTWTLGAMGSTFHRLFRLISQPPCGINDFPCLSEKENES